VVIALHMQLELGAMTGIADEPAYAMLQAILQ
jgi:hypothetical protein